MPTWLSHTASQRSNRNPLVLRGFEASILVGSLGTDGPVAREDSVRRCLARPVPGAPGRSLAVAGRGPNVRERGVKKTVRLALREAGFTLFFPTSTLPRNPNR